MKKLHLFIALLFLHQLAFSQEGEVIQGKATLFQLEQEKDTVEFIVVDTLLKEKKPIFLWCQGSLPQPLFGELEDGRLFFQGGGIANFDYAEIVKEYHLVVISMPRTPVVVSQKNLNNSFLYVPDKEKPNELSKAYIEADYLDNYVERGLTVMEFLLDQDWVAAKGTVVAGASQGSKVATKLAVKSPHIAQLGLFSPNPLGRIDQLVRQPRLDAQLGKITWEKADSLMNNLYLFFEKAHHPDSLKATPRLKAWKTFSEPFYDDWLLIDRPIYLAYGTEDRTSDLCDLVPLFFIQAGKEHLTLKRYLHLEHNFFEVDKNGRPDYEKGHWNDVMMAFLSWLKNDKKQ